MDGEADRKNSKLNPKWYTWLIFLLLPLVMYMPTLGADLQLRIVGAEQVCCMPDDYDELYKMALVARSKRSLSNAIINGSLSAGIVILAVFAVLFYVMIWRKLGKVGKIIGGVVVGALVMILLVWLLHLLEWYGANTEEYYYYGGSMMWPLV